MWKQPLVNWGNKKEDAILTGGQLKNESALTYVLTHDLNAGLLREKCEFPMSTNVHVHSFIFDRASLPDLLRLRVLKLPCLLYLSLCAPLSLPVWAPSSLCFSTVLPVFVLASWFWMLPLWFYHFIGSIYWQINLFNAAFLYLFLILAVSFPS